MQVIGEVIAQALAVLSGALVLAIIGTGVYMRISHRDPFSGNAPQPRSKFMWLYLVFMSLWLFTTAIFRLVPNGPNILNVALFVADIVFGSLFIFFFIKFLIAWRHESRHQSGSGNPV